MTYKLCLLFLSIAIVAGFPPNQASLAQEATSETSEESENEEAADEDEADETEEADSNDVDLEGKLGALKFRSIGPALMSGRIADIAVDPSSANTWYVAVGSGGVWKQSTPEQPGTQSSMTTRRTRLVVSRLIRTTTIAFGLAPVKTSLVVTLVLVTASI